MKQSHKELLFPGWLTHPAFLYKNLCSGMAPCTMSWALPLQSVIKKKKSLTDLPIGQCDEDISSLGFLLSRYVQACVKLTKNSPLSKFCLGWSSYVILVMLF